MTQKDNKRPLTYADSGVDIKAGEETVDRIKSVVAQTFNDSVLTGIGAFGGFFKPNFEGLDKPVLISSADGVGTKLKLAFMTGKHDTVGEDLVNHCVDDILVHGAKGLFFLDYIGTGKLNPDDVAGLVEGLARGCKNNGVALIGGETAEMPDMYADGEYDVAGTIIGVVEEDKIINGSTIKPGDVCLGLPSNGLHTNGYSLARKVAFEIGGLKPDSMIDELSSTVAEALMMVHKSYAPLVLPLLEKLEIHGMAHITGGGIPGNLVRILPDNCAAVINKGSWPVLPIFNWLKELGNIDPVDIYSSFNMGIGYIMVVPSDQADKIMTYCNEMDEQIFKIGEIIDSPKEVKLVD